jgi:hypothetical protein
MDMEEETGDSTLNKSSTTCSSLATPSLYSEEDDDVDMDDMEETCSTDSLRTAHHSTCDNTSQNGDQLPKSFLQLKGITVGYFNMGCNFHI